MNQIFVGKIFLEGGVNSSPNTYMSRNSLSGKTEARRFDSLNLCCVEDGPNSLPCILITLITRIQGQRSRSIQNILSMDSIVI